MGSFLVCHRATIFGVSRRQALGRLCLSAFEPGRWLLVRKLVTFIGQESGRSRDAIAASRGQRPAGLSSGADSWNPVGRRLLSLLPSSVARAAARLVLLESRWRRRRRRSSSSSGSGSGRSTWLSLFTSQMSANQVDANQRPVAPSKAPEWKCSSGGGVARLESSHSLVAWPRAGRYSPPSCCGGAKAAARVLQPAVHARACNSRVRFGAQLSLGRGCAWLAARRPANQAPDSGLFLRSAKQDFSSKHPQQHQDKLIIYIDKRKQLLAHIIDTTSNSLPTSRRHNYGSTFIHFF